LRATLESLAKMSVPPDLEWELIVVDNNCSDGSRGVIEDFARTSGLNVRYVFEARQGVAHALNTGVPMARGEIIAFTNDDVIIHPKWLATIRETFEEFGCMCVEGRIVATWEHGPKPSWAETEGPHRMPGVFRSFDLGEEAKLTSTTPWGGNMAFRKTAFKKYGLFRTDLGPVGYKKKMVGVDRDFGRRLVEGGEKIAYAPGAIVYHPVPPENLTKSYALSHNFNFGKSLVLVEGWPKGAICYFGVPRYMFRALVENFFKWITTLHRRARFYYKSRCYRVAGSIATARKLSKSNRDAPPRNPEYPSDRVL